MEMTHYLLVFFSLLQLSVGIGLGSSASKVKGNA